MSLKIDSRTGSLFGCCDGCRQEIKEGESATAEIGIPDSSRKLTVYVLHDRCHEDFAKTHRLVEPDFWARFSNPSALAAFDQLPESLPSHIAKILGDLQAFIQRSIDSAKKKGGPAK